MEIRQKLKNFIKNKWAGLCRHTHYVLLGIPFVLALAGLVLGVTAVIRINQILDRQSFQYVAERYESKVMPYRQMTVLGPGLSQGDGSAPRCTEEGLNIDKIKQLHETLDITERSTIGDTNSKGQGKGSVLVNPWKDCYSTTATYSAIGRINKEKTGTVDSCEVVGVGVEGSHGDVEDVGVFLRFGHFLDGGQQLILERFEQFDLLVLNVQLAGGDEVLQTLVEFHQFVFFHFEDGGGGGGVGQVDVFGLFDFEFVSHLLSHLFQIVLVVQQNLLYGVDAGHFFHDGAVVHVAEFRLLCETGGGAEQRDRDNDKDLFHCLGCYLMPNSFFTKGGMSSEVP